MGAGGITATRPVACSPAAHLLSDSGRLNEAGICRALTDGGSKTINTTAMWVCGYENAISNQRTISCCRTLPPIIDCIVSKTAMTFLGEKPSAVSQRRGSSKSTAGRPTKARAVGDHPSQEPTFRVLRLREQATDKAYGSKFDSSDDSTFYERPRFVHHVDEGYLDKLTALYRSKLKQGCQVLDLMSSWDSHLPADMRFERVEGHGMNEAELLANKRLDHFWVQDLNTNPELPHHDGSFDAVLISLGIQYLGRPEEVLQEVGRVLVPGGLLIVTFSKHSYTEKAVAGWLRRTAKERVSLVENLLQSASFEDIKSETACLGLESEEVTAISDPFYAVVGTKRTERDARSNSETESTYSSLAFESLSSCEEDLDVDSIRKDNLLETWVNAYDIMAKEAVELGIPRSAIPVLEDPLSKETVAQARDLLRGIIESRMSSNL